jgi:hypothetical protein
MARAEQRTVSFSLPAFLDGLSTHKTADGALRLSIAWHLKFWQIKSARLCKRLLTTANEL